DIAAVTVTTVYVGASADLVRGFITTPLERVIAAADGIDYIESSSKLGLSTITVRLKLNYDPNKALAEISSKVNQVRNDLPPEAQVPVINIESADSRFAAAYLSFTSDILQANQISNSLVRLRDIADVVLGAEDYDSEVRFSGERAVFMGVWPLPNANSLDVIKKVRAEIALIQKDLPTGLSGRIAYDATKYIQDAINE